MFAKEISEFRFWSIRTNKIGNNGPTSGSLSVLQNLALYMNEAEPYIIEGTFEKVGSSIITNVSYKNFHLKLWLNPYICEVFLFI